MDEEISAGCIVWSDGDGVSWCMDVAGVYNTPGTVCKLEGGSWVVARGNGWDDGCIYWEDQQGTLHCRDVTGSHGPPGGEYRSSDGCTWFGGGEAWLQLGDEAREYLAASESTRRRRKVALDAAPGPREWDNKLGVLARTMKKVGLGAEEGNRPCHEAPNTAASSEAARRRVTYGTEGLARILAAEAALNADFDTFCSKGKRVVWPEMPLRM